MIGDIFEGMEFGSEVEAHGSKWIVVKTVRSSEDHVYHLACEFSSVFPADIKLIQVEKKDQDENSTGN